MPWLGAAVVGIALDRLPTPVVMGILIPGVTLAPAASAVGAIVTGATVMAATITGVERITAGGFVQEVSSPGMRPESIIPSSTNLIKNG
jgi:hypothetical protein